MRILFITQWFDPEPAFKGLGFARALRDAGHHVEVLTAFPNYPGGVVYPGYKIRPRKREIVDGIRVTRVAVYPSHDRSAIGRVLNYLSFPLFATFLGLPWFRRFDATYVYHPPATAALPAVALRLLRGTPYVLDIQDLWPDTIQATGMVNNTFALKALGALCRMIYSRASRISVLSPGFKRELEKRGIAAQKIDVVYNWAEEEQTPGRPASLPEGWPEGDATFTVLFAGTMGRAQGLDAVVEAARLLRERRPHVRLLLMGGGVEREHLMRLAAGLENVIFIERQTRERAAECLQAADALLVHLRDLPLFAITIPSKVQAYLAAGRPIVAGLSGDAAALVDASGAGVTCRPDNPAAIAAAIERLADLPASEREAMGASGKAYYFATLTRARGISRAVELLETVIA